MKGNGSDFAGTRTIPLRKRLKVYVLLAEINIMLEQISEIYSVGITRHFSQIIWLIRQIEQRLNELEHVTDPDGRRRSRKASKQRMPA